MPFEARQSRETAAQPGQPFIFAAVGSALLADDIKLAFCLLPEAFEMRAMFLIARLWLLRLIPSLLTN